MYEDTTENDAAHELLDRATGSETDDIQDEFPDLYPKVLNHLTKGDDLAAWELIKEAELNADDEGRVWSEAREESHAQKFLKSHPEYIPNFKNWKLVQAELGNRRLTEANLAEAWFRVQQKLTKQSTGQADEFATITNDELEQTLASVRAEMRRRK